eukprot:6183488-Pleurochrysis_carterae.AAC.1
MASKLRSTVSNAQAQLQVVYEARGADINKLWSTAVRQYQTTAQLQITAQLQVRLGRFDGCRRHHLCGAVGDRRLDQQDAALTSRHDAASASAALPKRRTEHAAT